MILRYNEHLKNKIGSKTKPEPWMHIVIIVNSVTGRGAVKTRKCSYAVYVWDTREIIETGSFDYKQPINYLEMYADKARDNHEPLVGSGSSTFNVSVFQKVSQTDSLKRSQDSAIREQNKIRKFLKR